MIKERILKVPSKTLLKCISNVSLKQLELDADAVDDTDGVDRGDGMDEDVSTTTLTSQFLALTNVYT